MENLPDEILVKLLTYLPLSSLVNGLGLANWRLYWLVRTELSSGRLKRDLEINHRALKWSEQETTANGSLIRRLEASGLGSLHGISLVDFEQPQQMLESIKGCENRLLAANLRCCNVLVIC